jgi:hypothetical protein
MIKITEFQKKIFGVISYLIKKKKKRGGFKVGGGPNIDIVCIKTSD